jgi:nitroreductase
MAPSVKAIGEFVACPAARASNALKIASVKARNSNAMANSPHIASPEQQSLETLLRRRHSCRAFLDRPVPHDVITRVLEVAQLTASWCNAQPWQLHIACGKPLARYRDALLETSAGEPARPDLPFPKEYLGAYLERRRECGWKLYESLGIAKGDRAASGRQRSDNFRFFGAPHVAIVSMPAELGVYAAVDCGAYVANFLLAAESMGIAAIAQAALAAYPDVARRHLGIAEDRLVVCGISFGYEDAAHPANAFRTRRAPVQEAVVWVGDE